MAKTGQWSEQQASTGDWSAGYGWTIGQTGIWIGMPGLFIGYTWPYKTGTYSDESQNTGAYSDES